MTRREKEAKAKEQASARFNDSDFLRVGPFSWVSMEQVGEEEIVVELSFSARRNYDVDEAVEEWEFQQSQAQAKAGEKTAKAGK